MIILAPSPAIHTITHYFQNMVLQGVTNLALFQVVSTVFPVIPRSHYFPRPIP